MTDLTRLRIPLLFLLGLLYVFLIPIFEAPDEPAHFARAYGIAEGQFILQDHPKELVLFIRHQFECINSPETRPVTQYLKRYERGDKERVPNIAYNAALYSPVPYLPYAALIKAVMLYDPQGEVFKPSVYSCRMLSLLIFCSMLAISFHTCPGLSWPFFWLAATPMALSQASIVSLDPITFGSSVLLLSLTFGRCGKRLYALGLIISSAFLLLSKPPYLPILLIPLAQAFLNPAFDRSFQRRTVIAAMAISFAGMAIWQYLSMTHHIFETSVAFIGHFIQVKIDPVAQLRMVLQEPAFFLQVIWNTFKISGISLGYQMVGILGWLDIPVPVWTVLLWVLLVIPVLGLSEKSKMMPEKMSYWFGLFCMVISVGIVLGMMLSAYLLWAPTGASMIVLQGRYFHIPIAVLFTGIVMLQPALFHFTGRAKKIGQLILLAGCIITNLSAVHAVILRG